MPSVIATKPPFLLLSLLQEERVPLFQQQKWTTQRCNRTAPKCRANKWALACTTNYNANCAMMSHTPKLATRETHKSCQNYSNQNPSTALSRNYYASNPEHATTQICQNSSSAQKSRAPGKSAKKQNTTTPLVQVQHRL